MSQVRLTEFLRRVNIANTKFTEGRSSLKPLLALMRQQVATTNFNLVALGPSIANARADKRGAKYAAALTYLESVWGKGALEVKGPNQAAFAPLPPRLHVLKGSVVRFRGVDSGTEINHTFNVNSASNDLAGEITANIVLGGVGYPVKAIVFELVIDWTFADPFAGHSPTNLGVHEPVTLAFHTTPLNVTAAEAGDPTWALTGAAGASADIDRKLRGKLQRTATNAGAPLADGKAYFIAPWATAATLMGPSTRSSNVTLRLALHTGVSTGMFVEKTFTVHTPVARMVQRAPYKHVAGKPSAGFTGDIFFDPKNVSFKYITFKEGRGTMKAWQTGLKVAPSMNFSDPSPKPLPKSPSGYFAWEGARIHQHTPVWVGISGGNLADGSKLAGSDSVYTAPNPIWPAKYDASYVGLKGLDTDVPSQLEWPIFWKYQPVGLAGEMLFQQATHKSTMDRNGRVTTEKAGATISYDV